MAEDVQNMQIEELIDLSTNIDQDAPNQALFMEVCDRIRQNQTE